MFYGAPRGSFEFRNGPKVVRSGYCWLKCLPGGGATLEVRQLQRKSKSSVSRAIDRAVKESIRAQLGPKVKFFSRPPKRVTTLTMTLLADGTLRVPASAGNPAGKAAILKRVEPVPGRHGQGIAVEMEPAPGLPIRDPR